MSLKPLFAHGSALRPHIDAGHVIVTPNRRLSRAVIQAYGAQRRSEGAVSWPSVTALPLRQYAVECWNEAVTRGQCTPRVIVDSYAQRLLWRRVIEDNSRGFSLLSSSRAAQLCQEAAETLALWRLDPAEPSLKQLFSFTEDGRAFLACRDAVFAELRAQQLVTAEQAVEILLGGQFEPGRGLVGLHVEDLPPLFQSLCGAAPEAHFLDPRGPAALFEQLVGYEDDRGELQAAARWCADRCAADPAGRYAVVLSDMDTQRETFETLLRREFGCLTSDYDSLPVNFSTGFKLNRVPLIRDGLRILSTAEQRVSVEALLGLLHSPFVARLRVSPGDLEALAQRFRELAQRDVPLYVARQILASVSSGEGEPPPWDRAAQLDGQARIHGRPRAPSLWIPVIRSLLDCWGWAGGRSLDSLEYQQMEHWDRALDAFARLDAVVGPLPYATAVAQLDDLLAQQQFQPRTTDRAVQVLGPLETTGLSFDALRLTGMDGGRWPPPARPNPYLPWSLQREQRMPHCDSTWEWEWTRRRWRHWRHGSGSLSASYVNQEDGATVLPSPLLLSEIEPEAGSPARVDVRWESQRIDAGFDDVASLAVALDGQEAACEGVSSAVLQAQAQCPFRGFATARLRVAPVPEAAAGLVPAERGNMLHRALHRLFGELPSSAAIRQTDSVATEQIIDAAVADGMLALDRNRRQCLGAAIVDLESHRLRELLERWLAIEAGREIDFDVIAREQATTYSLAGLTVRLRIDRQDHLVSGDTVILDYKSGSVEHPNRWFEERPEYLQLPIYALAVPEATGIAYGSLKSGALGYSGIATTVFADGILAAGDWEVEGETAAERLTELRAHWTRELSEVAAEIASGEATVAPTATACRYCGRQSLCRIGDWQP